MESMYIWLLQCKYTHNIGDADADAHMTNVNMR